MCCIAYPQETQKLRSRKKPFAAYKVVAHDGRPPYQGFRYRYYIGLNVPKEPLAGVCKRDSKSFKRGALHVYRTKKTARSRWGPPKKIIRVLIRPEDVLGAERETIAVSKIWVTAAATKAAGVKLPRRPTGGPRRTPRRKA